MIEMTEAQWAEAFKDLDASPVSEDIKAYYRRVWTFEREHRGYSFPARKEPEPFNAEDVRRALNEGWS